MKENEKRVTGKKNFNASFPGLYCFTTEDDNYEKGV
jgi:hypothetical protein